MDHVSITHLFSISVRKNWVTREHGIPHRFLNTATITLYHGNFSDHLLTDFL